MRDALVAKGCELYYEEAQGAQHNETAWSARLGGVLEFLFPARV